MLRAPSGLEPHSPTTPEEAPPDGRRLGAPPVTGQEDGGSSVGAARTLLRKPSSADWAEPEDDGSDGEAVIGAVGLTLGRLRRPSLQPAASSSGPLSPPSPERQTSQRQASQRAPFGMPQGAAPPPAARLPATPEAGALERPRSEASSAASSAPASVGWSESVVSEPWRNADLAEGGRQALGRCLADFKSWTCPGGSGERLLLPPERLRVVREVGSGGCAKVFLAHDLLLESGQPPVTRSAKLQQAVTGAEEERKSVAVKKLIIPPGSPQALVCRALEDFHAEAKMLHRLQGAGGLEEAKGGEKGPFKAGGHPFIASLLGVLERPLCLVMDFCSGGNLMAALADRPADFDWQTTRRIAAQVASGVGHLHAQSPPILHRDLKSLNVLLVSRPGQQGTSGGEQLHAMVSDFGLSRFGATSAFDRMTAMCGTYHWMAPEVMAATPGVSSELMTYGPPVDVFSFAIVCWELATRQVPYEGWAAPQVIVAVAHRGERLPLPTPLPRAAEPAAELSVATSEGAPSSPEDGTSRTVCPEAFLVLIQDCWAQEPEARPTFVQIEEALANMGLV